MVRKERLELSHPKILVPKTSASTNSATLAKRKRLYNAFQRLYNLNKEKNRYAKMKQLFLFNLKNLGWIMGLEPTTTGITSRGSTN